MAGLVVERLPVEFVWRRENGKCRSFTTSVSRMNPTRIEPLATRCWKRSEYRRKTEELVELHRALPPKG
ncbi:MAG TPA: hypothetical protein DCE33_15215 [Rhodospirillaceae bacterium]|nr:hypothetical protein [Rhodospirillaceae bacterium]